MTFSSAILERQKTVRYLRDQGYDRVADAIEHGEHDDELREELRLADRVMSENYAALKRLADL